MVELKYKHKFAPSIVGKKADADGVVEDSHLYLGLSATRGMLCVAPELEKWVGKQLSDEYLAIKERRKAVEAAKPGK